jgi:hypothetical protein
MKYASTITLLLLIFYLAGCGSSSSRGSDQPAQNSVKLTGALTGNVSSGAFFSDTLTSSSKIKGKLTLVNNLDWLHVKKSGRKHYIIIYGTAPAEPGSYPVELVVHRKRAGGVSFGVAFHLNVGREPSTLHSRQAGIAGKKAFNKATLITKHGRGKRTIE